MLITLIYLASLLAWFIVDIVLFVLAIALIIVVLLCLVLATFGIKDFVHFVRR